MQQTEPSSSSTCTSPISGRLYFCVNSLPRVRRIWLKLFETESLYGTTTPLHCCVKLFQKNSWVRQGPRWNLLARFNQWRTEEDNGRLALSKMLKPAETPVKKIEEYIVHGVMPSTEHLVQALKAGADEEVIHLLVSRGLIPNHEHLKLALKREDKVLQALLDAGAKPTVDLLPLASEEQRLLLIQAGAFRKGLTNSHVPEELQKLCNSYSVVQKLLQSEGALETLRRMLRPRCPAALWMLHQALESRRVDPKIITLLLDLGIAPTPYALRKACETRNPEILVLLLDNGATLTQRTADLIVALWPPGRVQEAFHKIFPAQGTPKPTSKTLELAVCFSSWEVITSVIQRGTKPIGVIPLARALLREDITNVRAKQLLPKQRIDRKWLQRWCLLWGVDSAVLPTTLQSKEPDRVMIAAAALRGRYGFIESVKKKGALPSPNPIQKLAIQSLAPTAIKIIPLLAGSLSYDAKIIKLGSLEMALAVMKHRRSSSTEDRLVLERAAIKRRQPSAKILNFFQGETGFSKQLAFEACKRGFLPTIQMIFSHGELKVTRQAMVCALRNPKPDPEAVLWLWNQYQLRHTGKAPSTAQVPNDAFLGIDSRDPDRVMAFWNLIATLIDRKAFSDWAPSPLFLKLSTTYCKALNDLYQQRPRFLDYSLGGLSPTCITTLVKLINEEVIELKLLFNFKQADWRAIAKALSTNTSVKSVSLSIRRTRTLGSASNALAEAFEANHSITHFNPGRTQINFKAKRRIQAAVARNLRESKGKQPS